MSPAPTSNTTESATSETTSAARKPLPSEACDQTACSLAKRGAYLRSRGREGGCEAEQHGGERRETNRVQTTFRIDAEVDPGWNLDGKPIAVTAGRRDIRERTRPRTRGSREEGSPSGAGGRAARGSHRARHAPPFSRSLETPWARRRFATFGADDEENERNEHEEGQRQNTHITDESLA